MIKSMTGYGRGECILYDRKFVVEIKSVNHRYNDITIKQPKTMNPLEDKLRKKISGYVNRGKTDVFVTFESFSKDDIKISLNEALADAYVEELHKINNRYGLKDEISLSVITRYQDILTVEKNMHDEKTLEELDEALDIACGQALEQLIKMRLIEGESIKKDVLAKLAQIEIGLKKIILRAPLVTEEYSEKLKLRLSEAIEQYQIDEQRLFAEIAIFADKACIDEELARLNSHILQMKEILTEEEPVGRKLDFLVQEMNREVNTIGSKSNDLEIARLVVELKSEVEKIREQVQNIE